MIGSGKDTCILRRRKRKNDSSYGISCWRAVRNVGLDVLIVPVFKRQRLPVNVLFWEQIPNVTCLPGKDRCEVR